MANTRPIYLQVAPIQRGYPGLVGLSFSASFLAAHPLTGRLVADFRKNISDSDPLFRADSNDGTIVVTSQGVQIQIPADVTDDFTGGSVVFDIARVDPVIGASEVLPGRYEWPVENPVTRGAPISSGVIVTGSAKLGAYAVVTFSGLAASTVNPVLVVGPAGPVDRSYTDAQVAALLAQIDALSPPTLDFSRTGMAGTAPYIIRS